MKKLIIYLFLIAIAIGCKKEKQPEPQPVQQQQGAQKYRYFYDYKLQGDPTVYSSNECLTDAEMLVVKQLKNAFNIIRSSEC